MLVRIRCKEVLLDYLKRMKDGKTISVDVLSKATGVSNAQIRALMRTDADLAPYCFKTTAWIFGNKKTITQVRKLLNG